MEPVPTPEDEVKMLAARLEQLPKQVDRPRSAALGTYCGLKFSLELHPYNTPEVCVEGQVIRREALSRQFQGPRAVLNAVERIVDDYARELDKTRRDLEISKGQLKDYETRRGGNFEHSVYLEELHTLRDQLEQALSDKPKKGMPTQEELVTRIKALREAHTIEPVTERTKRQAASVEEAVTTRIMRGRAAIQEPSIVPEQVEMPTAEIMQFKKPAITKPKLTYRQKVKADTRQLTLF